MVDGKSISDHLNDFENLIYEIKTKGIEQSEIVYVSSLIKKLPPSWSDFARSIKEKLESFYLNELFVSLRIEDKHRSSVHCPPKSEFQAKALVIENSHKLRPKFFKKTRPKKSNGGIDNNKNYNKPKGNNMSSVQCWVCGRTNHVAGLIILQRIVFIVMARKTQRLDPRQPFYHKLMW